MTHPVKERPILFSAGMVRAIVAGRKSQTRRVIKPQPTVRAMHMGEYCPPMPVLAFRKRASKSYWIWPNAKEHVIADCPYGQPGELLWVREAYAIQCNVDDDTPPFSDGRPIKTWADEYQGYQWRQPHYRATDAHPELTCPENQRHNCGSEDICARPWRPSIHMPRWASRITLELTSVRVEKINAISDADSVAEGIEFVGREPGFAPWRSSHGGTYFNTPREAFANSWDTINAARGYPFDSGAWVWVLGFRKDLNGCPMSRHGGSNAE